jgi:hypothetical protein
MNHRKTAVYLICCLALSAKMHAEPDRTLTREALLDKIRGAWVGQMIGVAYGAAYEFKSNGKIIEGLRSSPRNWPTPSPRMTSMWR